MIQLYHNQSAKNIYLQNILDIIHIVNNAYILGDMQRKTVNNHQYITPLKSFQGNQLRLPCPHANLLRMLQGFLPMHVWIAVHKVVMVMVPVRLGQVVTQL